MHGSRKHSRVALISYILASGDACIYTLTGDLISHRVAGTASQDILTTPLGCDLRSQHILLSTNMIDIALLANDYFYCCERLFIPSFSAFRMQGRVTAPRSAIAALQLEYHVCCEHYLCFDYSPCCGASSADSSGTFTHCCRVQHSTNSNTRQAPL